MAKRGLPRRGIPSGGTPTAKLRDEIAQIRHATKLRGQSATLSRKAGAIWNRIGKELLPTDSRLIRTTDGDVYWYDGVKREVLPLSLRSRAFRSFLMIRFGLAYDDPLTRRVYSLMEAYAEAQGDPHEVRRFAHYDDADGVLYVNAYDGTMWKLDGTATGIVPNGQGCFFLGDDGGIPHYAHVAPNGILKRTLVDGVSFAGTDREAAENTLLLWIYAVGFRSLFASKPLLVLHGPAGSGKSQTIYNIQLALFGYRRGHILSKDNLEDFPIMLLRSPICFFDNLDNPIKGIQDQLAAYTTGAGFERRRKYTDSDYTRFSSDAMVAVTSRDPETLRRDDLADRMLILDVDRRESFTPLRGPNGLETQILQNRALLLGEWLYYANEIVAALRQSQAPAPSTERLGDWSAFCQVVAPVFGIAPEKLVEAATWQREVRFDMLTEGDVLIPLFMTWADYPTSLGEPKTVGQLYDELSAVATAHRDLTMPYKSPMVLAKNLKRIVQNLRGIFEIAIIRDIHTKQNKYIFMRNLQN